MLSYLFPRLTAPRASGASRGAALFEALVADARQPHWFVEGQVPDTIDGRFAVLATIVALGTVRLERGDAVARQSAVALAERFIEAMDAEHRQMGIGDPTVGKTVRKLVGALSRRVASWRQAVEHGKGWADAADESLFKETPQPAASKHCEVATRDLWARLDAASDEVVVEGRIG